MKYIVTKLEGPNEPIMFNVSSLGNYSVNTFLGDFPTNESPFPLLRQQSKTINCTMVTHKDSDSSVQEGRNLTLMQQESMYGRDTHFWTLHFDGSR